MTPEQQQAVVEEARSWLRTPYCHQGRVKGAGIDCAMILADVYHAVGLIPYIDPRPYPPDWHMHKSDERYLGWVHQYADRVQTPEPGDVVLYKYGRCVSHGGIVIDWPTIIHSYSGVGCTLDKGDGEFLSGRLYGFYRVRS